MYFMRLTGAFYPYNYIFNIVSIRFKSLVAPISEFMLNCNENFRCKLSVYISRYCTTILVFNLISHIFGIEKGKCPFLRIMKFRRILCGGVYRIKDKREEQLYIVIPRRLCTFLSFILFLQL